MGKLLIIQNITREGPGLLEAVLKRERVHYDVVNLDAGESLPSHDGYSAAVVLGGPDSANDVTPKMSAELAWVSEALKRGYAYLGICLGLQVGVKASGGTVVKGPVKEVGFLDASSRQYEVALTEAGRNDLLFAGLGDRLEVFQLHGETVGLTPAMTLLALGQDCPNQVVRFGERAYGIQSHFELTPAMLTSWAVQDPDLIPLGAKPLVQALEQIWPAYEKTGLTLMYNWLKLAGLVEA